MWERELRMRFDSHRSKLVAVAVIIAFALGLIFTLTRGERSRDLVLRIEPVEGADDLTVYVDGAVEAPGLYSLPRGSRVSEAIDLAGRLDVSDLSSLQLAATLSDEQRITVPEMSPAGSTAETEDSLVVSNQSDLININSASADELESLNGIGPVLAERIIERRETVGPFQSLDDLVEVNGISDRTVDELRDEATV